MSEKVHTDDHVSAGSAACPNRVSYVQLTAAFTSSLPVKTTRSKRQALSQRRKKRLSRTPPELKLVKRQLALLPDQPARLQCLLELVREGKIETD